jgi:predicted nuclease of predicted toxin-antitoxin system
LLDEMFSPVLAAIVRREGVDVTSVHELRNEGAEDQSVLLMAAQGGRCVVTVNHKDFAPMTESFYEQGLPHAGVVFIAGSVPTNAYAPIARAIVCFARDNPDGLQPYEVRWVTVSLD